MTMTQNQATKGPAESRQPLPWYRYPWPWVAIAIPGVAVVGGLFTLYLALTNPDPLVVEDHQYEQLRSQLQANPDAAEAAARSGADHGDPR